MPYIIFEGPDGIGKSTALDSLASTMSLCSNYEVHKVQLPGTTPLGKHLRKLVKNPHDINPEISIGPYTRQLLYAADYSAYANWVPTVLLDPNNMLLADRCSAISSYIYGDADGADVRRLNTIYRDINAPIADIAFIFCGQPDVIAKRLTGRSADYFDQKGLQFKQKICDSYNSLATPGTYIHSQLSYVAKKIVGINAHQKPEKVLADIIEEVNRLEPDHSWADTTPREPLVRLEYKLLHPDAKVPYRSRETDAGYDIWSIADIEIPPQTMVNVPTGIIVTCPSGYYIEVKPRSSLWRKAISPFNAIIDATYTGELFIGLNNFGQEPYQVHKGDRIAQIIIQRQLHARYIEVEEFSPEYNLRGTAGFGSSGR